MIGRPPKRKPLRAKPLGQVFRHRPGDVIPSHVKHCHATGSKDWWIYTWKKDNPALKTRVPYNCNSWRCPVCRKHEAHVTYARIMQASEGLDSQGFVFFVLTLDRDGYYSKRPWRDSREAFGALSRQSRRFQDCLRKWMLRQGMTPFSNEWVATVEAHRSGWPHMNMIIYAPELAEFLREHQRGCIDAGLSERDAALLSGELSRIATRTGWGVQSTGEGARNLEAAAGYIVKIAGLADKTAGEVAKLTQLPMTAPERFRRLRSGKGFLPPREKSEGVTGTLVRRERQPDGTYLVLPLHNVSAAMVDDVASCCYHEEDVAHAELSGRWWNEAAKVSWPEAVDKPPLIRAFYRPTKARGPPS